MEYRILLLELARVGDALRVAFHEQNGNRESALRPYELHPVAWEQVDRECREILSLLGRANRKNGQDSESLANLRRSGESLFDILLPQSIKAKLAHTKGSCLTLYLEDSLIHIPWHLLHDGREFFCRRFAIGRIISTRQTPTARFQRELKPPFSVLILADPRSDLEAAYHEGLALRNFLDARRQVFRADFKSYPVDVPFVKKILRDYDIVHYAGHAVYHADNPAESGWLLQDGTLSAGAIAAMGGSRPMPTLVFANACQSGRTEGSHSRPEYGEHIYGLANAFLLSGTRHYVGSFGDVLDEAGGVFAESFYGALAAGEEVGMALRQARLASIDRLGEAQLNWASYMLYGAPHSEFPSNGIGSPSYDFARGGGASHSSVLRGAEAGRAAIKEPRPRRWIAAASLMVTTGLLGYAFFHWERARNPATSVPAVMRASNVSDSPPQAPLQLSMQLIGQRKEPDGRFTEIVVNEGGVLRSGDQFQIHVKSTRSAYIYLILYDSRGQVSKLFPDPKIEQPGFVTAHAEITIPDKHLWFWLDNQPGTETIYALASEQPLMNISELLTKMESIGGAPNKPRQIQFQEPIKSIQRGVGGIAHAKGAQITPAQGSLTSSVTAVVISSGAAVRALSFRHE